MRYSIRLARVDEAERIAELNAVVQDLHYRERPDWFKAPDPDTFLPAIGEWFRSPLARLFVAETGPDLVGYSVGVKNDRPDTALKYGMTTVELDQVVVVPESRGAGVGQALCRAVIDWATIEGASRVELGTWAFNETAYGVFESVGFSPTVRRMSLTLPKLGDTGRK